MNITTLLDKVYFAPRLKKIDFYANRAGELQHRVLDRLVRMAENTEWGKKYDYKSIHTYEDFRNRLPIQTYEEVKPYVERLRAGEQNLLWPSEIRWFAKSSGTTNDKSKFLPVSKEALNDTHYQGGKDAVALYLGQNPDSRFFSGQGLILGGSHSPNLNSRHGLVGDLSAILIQNIHPLVNSVRVPSKKIALMSDFEKKIEAIANSAISKDVTSLSGVPSWMLVLIKRILEKTGKQSLEEIWPNLEVFFHGGVAFTPYREQYKEVIRSPKMHYVETYNASDGYFINAFGEELIVDNAEKGLARACEATGALISDYSAAPVFMDANAKCRHQWLIEFVQAPDSIENFAKILDDTLKEVNSDYEAKRQKNIALQPLEVIVARKDLFHDWLAQKGKLGGQHKVPRLSNTREYIEEMLELNN